MYICKKKVKEKEFEPWSTGLEFRVRTTTLLSSDVWWAEFWLGINADYLQNFNTKNIFYEIFIISTSGIHQMKNLMKRQAVVIPR